MISGNTSIQQPIFRWPDGKRAALSLSFDDARLSQTDCALPILDAHCVKATFYVSPAAVEQRIRQWHKAIEHGHEIGNHTMNHPCSGNFAFARSRALEDYTLERMEEELLSANDAIEHLLGVQPITFAYPCGQKFVGRGEEVQSYVPLVARHFLVGRSAFDEIHNDPTFVDLAQATALDADGASFEQIKAMIDHALEDGGWLILLGHEAGTGGRQTVLAEVLEKLCCYVQNPENGIWMETVATIGNHIAQTRKDAD